MYYYFGWLIINKTVMAFSASVNTIFLGTYLTFYNCIIRNIVSWSLSYQVVVVLVCVCGWWGLETKRVNLNILLLMINSPLIITILFLLDHLLIKMALTNRADPYKESDQGLSCLLF